MKSLFCGFVYTETFLPTFILETPTDLFGKKLHEQVEDRLKFYETGEAPIKNADAMQEVLDEFAALQRSERKSEKKKKKKQKKEKDDEEEVLIVFTNGRDKLCSRTF